ncbi:MAG: HEAT repeat domain-containing protein [Verrucomicrobia bacterium]|nr:HEAT repeat domain-containing protein [Leptolyngbya sp. ES-bin-22]
MTAVRALADARLEEGIPALIQALGYNNPGAAVMAVNGLVQLSEVAVQPLLEQLDGYNYGARAYAIRALAAIADPRALDALLDAAVNDFAPSVRRAAIKGIGSLHWQLLAEDDRAIAQTHVLETLLLVSSDPDWANRYAAVVGLQALAVALAKTAIDTSHVSQLSTRLAALAQTDPDPATKARARMAQQHLRQLSQPLLVA